MSHDGHNRYEKVRRQLARHARGSRTGQSPATGSTTASTTASMRFDPFQISDTAYTSEQERAEARLPFSATRAPDQPSTSLKRYLPAQERDELALVASVASRSSGHISRMPPPARSNGRPASSTIPQPGAHLTMHAPDRFLAPAAGSCLLRAVHTAGSNLQRKLYNAGHGLGANFSPPAGVLLPDSHPFAGRLERTPEGWNRSQPLIPETYIPPPPPNRPLTVAPPAPPSIPPRRSARLSRQDPSGPFPLPPAPQAGGTETSGEVRPQRITSSSSSARGTVTAGERASATQWVQTFFSEQWSPENDNNYRKLGDKPYSVGQLTDSHSNAGPVQRFENFVSKLLRLQQEAVASYKSLLDASRQTRSGANSMGPALKKCTTRLKIIAELTIARANEWAENSVLKEQVPDLRAIAANTNEICKRLQSTAGGSLKDVLPYVGKILRLCAHWLSTSAEVKSFIANAKSEKLKLPPAFVVAASA